MLTKRVCLLLALLLPVAFGQTTKNGCGDGTCLSTCNFDISCKTCHNPTSGDCMVGIGCAPESACWTFFRLTLGRGASKPAKASRIAVPEGVPPLSDEGIAAKKVLLLMEIVIGHPLNGSEIHQLLGVSNYDARAVEASTHKTAGR